MRLLMGQAQINFPYHYIDFHSVTYKKQIKHAQACLIFQIRSHIVSYCQILPICAKLAEFSMLF